MLSTRNPPAVAPAFADGYWGSDDGLRLHYRDYAGPADRPAILCLAGLTRNARDYEGVAGRLAGAWRVIVVELRGRGDSAFAKDAMTYVPLTYLQDVEALLAKLKLPGIVAFGTSLGGILTMLLATTGKQQFAGVLLNDVGPDLDQTGLSRIRTYVGRPATYPTWMHAARGVQEANAAIYPNHEIADWLVMAKRLHRLNSSGRIVLDYDMKIAEPFRLPGNEAGHDMWRAFDAIGDTPMLVVRGETSDILNADGAAAMLARAPRAELVTIPRVGHAPTLEEPEAVAAIDRLLAKVLGASR